VKPRATMPDFLPLLLGRVGVGVILTNADGFVAYLSPFAEHLTGWKRADATGERLEKVFRLVAETSSLPGEPPAPTLSGGAGRPGGVEEALLLSRDGQRFVIEHVVAPIRDQAGRIAETVVVFVDVSQRNFAALQLARQARYDPLTGLLNRSSFTAHLERALREVAAGASPIALCHLDLYQFNLVNNACGHAAGDDLLQWVAALLREEGRENDVIARLGGDVFVVLLRGRRREELRAMASALLRRLHAFQFTWEDKTFTVGACLGLVPVEGGQHTVAEVLAAAHHACSEAKRRGRDQTHLCDLEDEELLHRGEELAWVARIDRNLREGRVVLFAQEIRVLGRDARDELRFEVLLRTRTDGQIRSAAGVIQAAERFGLMGTIDRWVIRTALQTLARQPRETLARLKLCSINISSVSLHDAGILEFIGEQLAEARIAPQKICFELTETAAVANLLQARWLIEALLSIGCRFSLDDFGSGLTSYSYLKDLPVNFLKIDGIFTERVASSNLDRAMVESINQIAHVLGLETVAEAVSGQRELEILREIGVDFGQGHHLGRPRPLDDVLAHPSVLGAAAGP